MSSDPLDKHKSIDRRGSNCWAHACSSRYVIPARCQKQPDGRQGDGVVKDNPLLNLGRASGACGGGGAMAPSGPAASNTEATQVRALAKINTPTTRTRRHSPAHGGTTAKMSM